MNNFKEFKSSEDLKAEIADAEAGSIKFDYYSPEAIETSRKLKSSVQKMISGIALTGSIAGIIIPLIFIYWTSVFDYPINIGGKEFFSIIYLLPLLLVTSIFTTLLFTVIAFLYYSSLPKWKEKNNDKSGRYIFIKK